MGWVKVYQLVPMLREHTPTGFGEKKGMRVADDSALSRAMREGP